MKRILLTSILCLSFINIFSQNIEAKKSEIFKDKKKNSALSFVEEDGNGGYITLRAYYGGMIQKVKGYYIEHFNEDLELIKEYEIEAENNTIEGVLINNGKINLIEFFNNKKDKKREYNLLTSSLDNFDFTKRNLFSINNDEIKKFFGFGIGLVFINNFDKMDGDSFGEVTFSSNKNFILFNFDVKNDDIESHKLFVYDKNFEKVYEQSFEEEIKDKYFEYQNVDVDDTNGTVYFLGKVFKNQRRKAKKEGKANYYYQLNRINENSSSKLVFDIGDHFVGSLTTVRNDGNLVCVGFYSDENDYKYKGVCRFDIDESTMKIKNQSFLPFSEQFILDKYGKSKDKELKNLDYRGVFFDDNGDLIINAEEYYERMHQTMSSSGGWRTYYTYHYDDIIAIKVSAEGKLLWARNINKRQATGSSRNNYDSYTSTIKDDKNYFFINCSDKIKKLSNDRIQFNDSKKKKSNVYMIVIDSKGNFDFKSILDNKENKVPFSIGNGVKSGDGFGDQILFTGADGKNKQFLKLYIN